MALPSDQQPPPRIPQWTLGERMSKSRRAAGYSQAQMAEKFEASEATISSWETEARRPHNLLDVLKRWAELCNVDYTWLVTGSGTIVTYGDTTDALSYTGPVVVDPERQGRLALEPFPPSRSDPNLTLV